MHNLIINKKYTYIKCSCFSKISFSLMFRSKFGSRTGGWNGGIPKKRRRRRTKKKKSRINPRPNPNPKIPNAKANRANPNSRTERRTKATWTFLTSTKPVWLFPELWRSALKTHPAAQTRQNRAQPRMRRRSTRRCEQARSWPWREEHIRFNQAEDGLGIECSWIKTLIHFTVLYLICKYLHWKCK